jgi:hypothetical protein
MVGKGQNCSTFKLHNSKLCVQKSPNLSILVKGPQTSNLFWMKFKSPPITTKTWLRTLRENNFSQYICVTLYEIHTLRIHPLIPKLLISKALHNPLTIEKTFVRIPLEIQSMTIPPASHQHLRNSEFFKHDEVFILA